MRACGWVGGCVGGVGGVESTRTAQPLEIVVRWQIAQEAFTCTRTLSGAEPSAEASCRQLRLGAVGPPRADHSCSV